VFLTLETVKVFVYVKLVSAANLEPFFFPPNNSNYFILFRGLKMPMSFLHIRLAKSEIFENIHQGLSWQQLRQGKDLIRKSPFKYDWLSLKPTDPVSSINSQTMQYHIPEDLTPWDWMHFASIVNHICCHALLAFVTRPNHNFDKEGFNLRMIFNFKAPLYNIQHYKD